MFRKRKPILTREQSLAAIPVRNTAIREETDEEGNVRLCIPIQRKGFLKFLGRILNVPETDRKISLDELGSYVWRMCDGKTDVRTLIERFSRQFKLNRKEAEISMVEYLRTLARRRLVGIMVPKSAEGCDFSREKCDSPKNCRR